MKKKIEWNKVTWYSKTLAAVIFIILPLITFYYGIQMGFLMSAEPPQVIAINYIPSGQSSVHYSNPDYQFALEYPNSWRISESVDPYTLASITPKTGGVPVKVFLEKNNFKNIEALKSAKDASLGSEPKFEIRHMPNFDALIYTNIPKSGNSFAAMFVMLGANYILGVSGPDNKATLDIFDSFRKI